MSIGCENKIIVHPFQIPEDEVQMPPKLFRQYREVVCVCVWGGGGVVGVGMWWERGSLYTRRG